MLEDTAGRSAKDDFVLQWFFRLRSLDAVRCRCACLIRLLRRARRHRGFLEGTENRFQLLKKGGHVVNVYPNAF